MNIAIIIFVVLELANVLVMYFKPDFKYGNSMRSFAAWDDSKQDEKQYLFARYMVNWVANCKLIFIALLLVILVLGNEKLKLWGVILTVVSIGVYFITLHPIIKKLDAMGEIVPAGYSKQLGLTIGAFMLMFLLSLILHFCNFFN